ncbi:MAG: hypothetical protein ACJ79S_06150 [Gemmatimonadaceae bacterium]
MGPPSRGQRHGLTDCGTAERFSTTLSWSAAHYCASFASSIRLDEPNPAAAAAHVLARVASARGERGPTAKRLQAGELSAVTWLRQMPEAECHCTLGIGHRPSLAVNVSMRHEVYCAAFRMPAVGGLIERDQWQAQTTFTISQRLGICGIAMHHGVRRRSSRLERSKKLFAQGRVVQCTHSGSAHLDHSGAAMPSPP